MDIKAINQAIQGTPLEGRLSGEDLDRWRVEDKTPKNQPPLWLSVLIAMAASLDMRPDEVNPILQATIPKGKTLPGHNQQLDMVIDPGVIAEPSIAAEASLQRGDTEASQALWLEAIKAAHDARMSMAEPYRMFGNLAATAFMNGEMMLGEAALDIALKLNPNYDFAQKLFEQHQNGEFLVYSMKKLADSPRLEIVTSKDLEVKTNDELFAGLADQGIQISEKKFTTLAKPFKATIDPLVNKMIALASDAEACDEDYIHATCEVLWGRLIGRPTFETLENILYDLEDAEQDSNLYFDCIKKLAWAFKEADTSIFAHYQKYPHELAGLRYTIHDLLAHEVLRDSGVADDMLNIAEQALATGYFPDMSVRDIVSRIANGKNWQYQCEKLLERHPEYSQVLTMGLARGLLEIDNNYQAIGVSQIVWQQVLEDTLVPQDPAILSIADYMLAACQNVNDKVAERRIKKEQLQIESRLINIRAGESALFKEKTKHTSYELLSKSNKYPDMFAYEKFLQLLKINFATTQPTVDNVLSFSLRTSKKIGRNEPCPCGSGKKYKKCHGAPA